MSPFLRLRGAHLTSHPVIEDVVFSILSLLVVAVALTAVLAPPEATIAATVTAMAPNAAPTQVYLYGTLVDTAGQPISGARIATSYKDGTRVASTRTATDGSWSLKFKDGPAPYTITVTVIVNGQPVTGTVAVDAAPGMKWGVQMVFAQPSTWVFVPLPGY